MANKLNQEARKTIQTHAERGQSYRAIARLLGVHENGVRFYRRRDRQAATDGCRQQKHLAADFQDAIAAWMEQGVKRHPVLCVKATPSLAQVPC